MARDAIAEALRLDPRSADAHLGLATLAYHDRDWELSEREFLQALDANPNLAAAHLWYGLLLYTTGRRNEGMQHARQSLDLDPLSATGHYVAGYMLFYKGQYADAASSFQNAIGIDPGKGNFHAGLGASLVLNGATPEGIAELEHADALDQGTDPHVRTYLAWAYTRVGRIDDLATIRASMLKDAERGKGNAIALAGLFAISGDADKAFEWLERSRREPGGFTPTILLEPWFDNIRSDPRFVEFRRKLGLK
jgi:tetratricopeptide (TPR) repeat protein